MMYCRLPVNVALVAICCLSGYINAQNLNINFIGSRTGGAQTESSGPDTYAINSTTGQVTATTPLGTFNITYETNAQGYRGKTPQNYTIVPSATTRVNVSSTAVNATFQPPTTGASVESASPDEFDYTQALGLSILFYEAQRSGYLNNSRLPWRSDSATGDKAPDGKSLVGGHYDAGDNLKLNFPAAFAFTLVAWGLLEFPQEYKNAGQFDYAQASVKWATDFFIKCHHSSLAFTVQVGDPDIDHTFWIPPEQMTESRPAYDITPGTPGSDALGAVVACLAAGYQLFRGTDPGYSLQLIAHARDLYTFARSYTGKYSDGIQKAYVYPSSGYIDELAFAAAWLYRVTGEQQFLIDAQKYHAQLYVGTSFSWDDKSVGSALMLAQLIPNPANGLYVNQVQQYLNAWTTGTSGVQLSPKGLSFVSDWGSLRYAGNAAAIAVLYSKASPLDPKAKIYACWARKQVRYVLGSTGRSYMVGYGNTPPLQVHHRAASCPGFASPCGFDYFNSASPNPNVIFGAVVGGPHVDDSFADSRRNYQTGEVALDYNAGFTVALAFLSGSGLPGANSWSACASSGVS